MCLCLAEGPGLSPLLGEGATFMLRGSWGLQNVHSKKSNQSSTCFCSSRVRMCWLWGRGSIELPQQSLSKTFLMAPPWLLAGQAPREAQPLGPKQHALSRPCTVCPESHLEWGSGVLGWSPISKEESMTPQSLTSMDPPPSMT